MEKMCPICSGAVLGRSDKIFCSVDCQKAHYNEKSRKENEVFRSIDKQLKLNRKILKQHNKVGKTTLRREALHRLGFNPNYFTHFKKNYKGEIYYYCYEFGFLKVKESQKEKYLIINWQPQKQ